MYVCMYVYMYVCTYIHTYVRMYVCMYVCVRKLAICGIVYVHQFLSLFCFAEEQNIIITI